MTWDMEGAARRAEESRAAQGLPPGIEDPTTLANIATIIGPTYRAVAARREQDQSQEQAS